MNFKKLAVASAIAIAASSSFAAAGDVVFSSGFEATIGSASPSFTWSVSFADLAAGAYDWEAAITGTGPISFSSVTFNGIELLPLNGAKYRVGTGSFDGSPIEVIVKGTTSGKASFGGAVTITSAVPEPETYALMLAGLAAVGFVARRRKA